MALASIAAGAIWGLIPAIFKARWDTNETLFTLMLNYVAIQLTSYCRGPLGKPRTAPTPWASSTSRLHGRLVPAVCSARLTA